MKANKISSDTIFKSNNYGDFRILNDFYDNEKKRRYAIIEFVDTGYSYKVRYCEAIKGCVKDPFRKNHKNCTSKYFGVVFDKRYDSYQVQINYKGKQYYLGKYDSEEVAANVYNHYARKLGITITLNDCEFISFEDCMKAKKTKRKLKIDSIIQEELL